MYQLSYSIAQQSSTPPSEIIYFKYSGCLFLNYINRTIRTANSSVGFFALRSLNVRHVYSVKLSAFQDERPVPMLSLPQIYDCKKRKASPNAATKDKAERHKQRQYRGYAGKEPRDTRQRRDTMMTMPRPHLHQDVLLFP